MAQEKMTWAQLVDILAILWKVLFSKDIKWDDVPCKTAQEILKGDHQLFAVQFLKFLAVGGRVVGGLLRKLTAVQVKGATRFVAKDHLTDTNVGWTGGNFKAHFLDKVEENVGDANVAVQCLEQSSLDAPILAELGERAEIKLAHLFNLLTKQSNGQEGTLLVNGYANIAYIRDAEGTLWAVDAGWDSGSGDWYVEAYSVEDPDRWDAGRQILARDS